MKKIFFIALMAVAGLVPTLQAVVISWDSDSLVDGTTSASLVYVSGDGLTSATISTASDAAIAGSILYTQTSTDSAARSSGYYYVLLNTSSGLYKSTESLAYNDSIISTSELDPPTGIFTVSSFVAVPEPCAATLLCMGVAVAALRRRIRG